MAQIPIGTRPAIALFLSHFLPRTFGILYTSDWYLCRLAMSPVTLLICNPVIKSQTYFVSQTYFAWNSLPGTSCMGQVWLAFNKRQNWFYERIQAESCKLNAHVLH
ncbi:MAG: hypothetical protein ACTS2F_06260 [Thainema sp.]